MKRFRGLLVTAFFIGLSGFSPDARAQDLQLENLKATQKQLRAHEKEYLKNYGGGPELTVIKHQLRDWVESKLSTLAEKGDEKALGIVINDLIKAAGLDVHYGNPDNDLGTAGEIKLSREGDLILLKTRIGILCMYDESAYAYEWKINKWDRVWESEQTDYATGKYSPQYINSIQVWRPYESESSTKEVDERFILSLGFDGTCASNWHNVYWRLWRIDSSETKLLLDRSHYAFMPDCVTGGFDNHYIYPGELFVEFKQGSMDTDVHNREAVYHYSFDRNQARRMDPIALSPRDFVDEWLQSPWNEIEGWSKSDDLRPKHEKYKDMKGFFAPTRSCRTPDLWQVTLDTMIAAKDRREGPPLYFLVRWRPPYHFTMMDIRNEPWPLCNQKDEQADEWRTLFPTEMYR